MMKRKTLAVRNLVVGLLALGLSGCGAVVVGAAATGAAVVHDRRPAATVVEDQNIYLKANDLRNKDPDIQQKANIDIDVFNYQVLLTGQAESHEVIEQFKQRVAAIASVRTVFNEVVIGAESTLSESTSDSYLTSRVKVALFNVKIKDFDPTRVKVVSSQGSVYLMGLLTPTEADAVVEEVRFVGGVKRVVKLFEYLDE
jgi:osmotically-inducible protein OsmY